MQTKQNDPAVRFQLMVSRCAEQGRKTSRDSSMSGICRPLRLVAMPADTAEKRDGSLHLIADNAPLPDGAVPVCDDMLGIDVPYAHYENWVRNRAGRAPVLGY